jgi:hypothetical protein
MRGNDHVLGKINVSSVFPIPDEASAEIARRVADRLQSKPLNSRTASAS